MSEEQTIKKTQRFRHWLFTINNYEPDDDLAVVELIEDNERVKYGVAEHEIGEEGTPHIQGYVSFNKPQYRSTVERWLNGKAWLSAANGTWDQNLKYCTKEGQDNIIVLKEPTNRFNSSFNEMYADMSNMTPDEFAEKYPKVWFSSWKNVLHRMGEIAMKNAEVWPGKLHEKNIWIWGPAGCGKTKWATSLCPLPNIYMKNFNKWWDGFSILTSKVVVLDDYPNLGSGGNTMVQHLKRWADRYPVVGECKGTQITLEPGRFIFIVTSNYAIEECFQTEEDIAAIKRRFHEIEITRDNYELIGNLGVDFSILKEK